MQMRACACCRSRGYCGVRAQVAADGRETGATQPLSVVSIHDDDDDDGGWLSGKAGGEGEGDGGWQGRGEGAAGGCGIGREREGSVCGGGGGGRQSLVSVLRTLLADMSDRLEEEEEERCRAPRALALHYACYPSAPATAAAAAASAPTGGGGTSYFTPGGKAG
jgi:hypothetical protein